MLRFRQALILSQKSLKREFLGSSYLRYQNPRDVVCKAANDLLWQLLPSVLYDKVRFLTQGRTLDLDLNS